MLALLRRGQLSQVVLGHRPGGRVGGSGGGAARPTTGSCRCTATWRVFTGRGLDLAVLFRQLLGRDGGYTGGRDRTFHFGTLDHHVVGMISHLGAMAPVADGLALAARLRGEDRVAAVLIGDGATSEGDVHEAMNLAAVWRLGVMFVVENNHWGLSTPVTEQYACADLADRAAGYGMPGRDRRRQRRRGRARRGGAGGRAGAGRAAGPPCSSARRSACAGHEEASGTDYVPAEQLAAWVGARPDRPLRGPARRAGLLPAAASGTGARPSCGPRSTRLVADALAAPSPASTADARAGAGLRPGGPDPPGRGHAGGVRRARARGRATSTPSATPCAMALAGDDRVVLLGQDIAGYGGVFKATEGLADEFGAERVRNTPIIESGAMGAALGLALDGFRPVVEMQFGDFVSCGFNQLVNNVATTRYRWGAPVPLVVRLPVGGGLGAGPFHSQNVEAWFCHVPGLKVVAPATPADAKGLLLAALDDGNPVLVLEHKRLYRSARGPVPAGHHVEPLGRARIARPGRDATVVTYGAGVGWALAAADAVAADGGGEVEVVDLRTLRPVGPRDRARLGAADVAGTGPARGRRSPAGSAPRWPPPSATEAFAWLDAPWPGSAALDSPIPFAPSLEAVWSAESRVLRPALGALLAF